MSHLYRFGPYLLDPQKRTLYCDKSPVPLTPKALDVLLFVAQNPNRLITKDELLKAVWGDTFVEEGNLTQYISHLRKALADNSEDSLLIVTISRKGYQFAADVALAETPDVTKRDAAQVPTSGVSTPGIAVEAKAGNQNSPAEAPNVLESPKVNAAIPKPASRWLLRREPSGWHPNPGTSARPRCEVRLLFQMCWNMSLAGAGFTCASAGTLLRCRT